MKRVGWHREKVTAARFTDHTHLTQSHIAMHVRDANATIQGAKKIEFFECDVLDMIGSDLTIDACRLIFRSNYRSGQLHFIQSIGDAISDRDAFHARHVVFLDMKSKHPWREARDIVNV